MFIDKKKIKKERIFYRLFLHVKMVIENVGAILARKKILKRAGCDDDCEYCKSCFCDVLTPCFYLVYLLKVLKHNILKY